MLIELQSRFSVNKTGRRRGRAKFLLYNYSLFQNFTVCSPANSVVNTMFEINRSSKHNKQFNSRVIRDSEI